MSDLKVEADLSIARLDLQPGDVLVAKWNRHAGDAEQAWAYEQLSRVTPPGVRILMGGPDLDLSVMRPVIVPDLDLGPNADRRPGGVNYIDTATGRPVDGLRESGPADG